jgi:hypothetical protein
VPKPIDFRRVQAAEARMAEQLRCRPDLAERTAAFLAGDPPPRAMEALMSDKLEHPTVIRLPDSILTRADALKPWLSRTPEIQMMGRLTRNAVLRLAILKGLEILEQQYRRRPDEGA